MNLLACLTCVSLRQYATGLAVLCVLAVSIASIAGCEDVQLGFGTDQASPKPAGLPIGHLESQPAKNASDGTASNPTSSAGSTARLAKKHDEKKASQSASLRNKEARNPVSAPLNIYQLVLLSEPGPAVAPIGTKHVRLNHAKAKDVAAILMLLYVPAGPSGSDNRYTLIYTTSLELDRAAAAAQLWDVSSRASSQPATTMQSAWDRCAGELLLNFDRNHSTDEWRHLADQLSQLVISAEVTRLQRWMSAMLAGEILANRVYDYASADLIYQQAESLAEPGSYEQMAAMFARSCSFYQDGKRQQARKQCEAIIGQFSQFRECELFARTRQTLAALERGNR